MNRNGGNREEREETRINPGSLVTYEWSGPSRPFAVNLARF
jgi:hypothetical protein